MNKLRELKALRNLEKCAKGPTPSVNRALVKLLAIGVVLGVSLSIADHFVAFKSLRWIYFGAGLLAGMGSSILAATFRSRFVSKFLDMPALRQRIESLQHEIGANV